ncbi:hypothetical protein H0A61_01172 [Koleobacter methoxysyntrophicus]|uniref:TolC family protein n=1 Tax=Koleobacter methoxysyntrophicus TaxID=2751313 RepID=A0A8A0RN02_9FIRM|nr:TolC family protein [Koleobacter methoxysyntrophicus]QSQ08827.1 hypothetical protein H0A61_01172 [Koleobacter methoxysyntrophicus]
MLKRARIIPVVLALLLAGSLGVAAVSGDVKPTELSLEQCFKLAEENNNQIKLAKLGIDKAKIAKRQFNRQYDLYEEAKVSSYEMKSAMEVGKVSTEMGVVLAEKAYESAIQQVKFGVEAAYYAALQARDSVEINEASLKRAEEQLQLSKLEYKVGRVAKRDVLDAEVQAARARADYNQALRDRDIAYMKLKQVIGIELDTPIKLISNFSLDTGMEINLEEAINWALNERIEVLQAEYGYAVAQKDFEIADAFYSPNVYTYKEKELALQEARIKLEDTKALIEAEVREAYFKMKGAEESIEVLEKSVEYARESLRLAKLQYQAGLIRSIDVMAVENALKQAEAQKAVVIYGYNLAKAQFYNAIGGNPNKNRH